MFEQIKLFKIKTKEKYQLKPEKTIKLEFPPMYVSKNPALKLNLNSINEFH